MSAWIGMTGRRAKHSDFQELIGCVRARRSPAPAGSAVASAPAQDAQPAARARPIDAAPARPGRRSLRYQPGFIDAVGRWLEEGARQVQVRACRARRRISTGSAVRRATPPRMPPARSWPCRARAWSADACAARPRRTARPTATPRPTALCQQQGLPDRQSLDTQTEQKCPAGSCSRPGAERRANARPRSSSPARSASNRRRVL